MIGIQEESGMADHEHYAPLSEFVRDAPKLLDELEASGTELLLEDRGRVFRIAPKQGARHRKRFDRQDPLFALGGAFASAEKTDITNDKHAAIADAYADLHVK
jgi:hypothetical protein